MRFESNVLGSQFDGMPKEYSAIQGMKKSFGDWAFRMARSPRRIIVQKPCDMIHTDGAVIPLNKKPWVTNVEYVSAFYGFDNDWHKDAALRRRLVKLINEKECRFLLPLSQASRMSIETALCAEDYASFSDKVRVIPPALSSYLVSESPPKEDGAIRILFVGNSFIDKGGREVLKAFLRLRNKYDIRLKAVTRSPQHLQEQFEPYKKILETTEEIEYVHSIPTRQELFTRFFKEADVFVFPSYMDLVPTVLLEAMGAGLPIVASDVFSIPEMAIPNQNAIVVHAPIRSFETSHPRTNEHLRNYRDQVKNERIFQPVVDELEGAISLLVEDGQLRRRYAAESLRMVKSGPYSVGVRNSALAATYEESLKF